MIRALVSGVLHADPVIRTSQNGNSYTTAKLRADGKDGASVWCNLIAFGAEGERLATVKAGSALSVAGRAEVTAWLDREGEAKAGLSLVVDELATLRGKPRPKPAESEEPPPPPAHRSNRPHRQRPPPPETAQAEDFDDLDGWTP
jgi:single-stranded DNA-binding protein